MTSKEYKESAHRMIENMLDHIRDQVRKEQYQQTDCGSFFTSGSGVILPLVGRPGANSASFSVSSPVEAPTSCAVPYRLAQTIAKEITEVLPQCAVAAKQEDDEAYLLSKSLFRIGNLVGLSDLELEKAYRSKEKP